VSPAETGGKASVSGAHLWKLQSSMRASSSSRSWEQDEMLGLTRASYVYISVNRAEGFRVGMIRGDEFWTGRDRHKFFGKAPLFDKRTFPFLMLCVSLEPWEDGLGSNLGRA
jgi:hypothetical protein